MTVLLVGDRPSPHNSSPDIAFVGTKSHDTLLDWCKIMDIYMPQFANRIDSDLQAKLVKAKLYGIPVIALGNEADKFLRRTGVSFFKLPHPSGLNRKLNDRQWLLEQLNECKTWCELCSTGKLEKEAKNAK